MLIKTTGLVIRSIKYGESSLIFDLYTKSHGYVSFIVGGVRKPKARMSASLFQVMNWVEVVAYLRDPAHLNRVKETYLIHSYKFIPFDFHRRSVGLFITEVVQKTIREREANEHLYHFLWHTFQYLDHPEALINNTHILFLIRFSGYLGFLPNTRSNASDHYFNLSTGSFEPFQHPVYSLNEEMSGLLSECLNCEVDTAHLVRLDRTKRRALIQNLITFYKLHLEKLPEIQTHKILAEVLEG